jgi:hypothetical protein
MPIARKGKKQCEWCSATGPRSRMFCDYHAGYHAGHSARPMREKRAKSPAYRKDERKKVRARMRTIRADRREAGVTSNGTPYKSQVWARKAVDREGFSAS